MEVKVGNPPLPASWGIDYGPHPSTTAVLSNVDRAWVVANPDVTWVLVDDLTNNGPIVVGFDIGMNSMGVAAIWPQAVGGPRIVLMDQVVLPAEKKAKRGERSTPYGYGEKLKSLIEFAAVKFAWLKGLVPPPVGLGIEDAFFGLNMYTTKSLAKTFGAVACLSIQQLGLVPYEIPHSTAKKTLTGSGKATKHGIMEAVCWQFGLSTAGNVDPEGLGLQEHAADAVAVAVATANKMGLWAGREPQTDP